MSKKEFDLVVIGSGPGGYVGAIRGAQLGLKVALVEKNEHLGGTCLNVGCIPTKALLHSAKVWQQLLHADVEGFKTGKLSYDWEKIMARKQGIVDAQRKGLRFLMKKNKIQVFKGFGSLKSAHQVTVTADDGSQDQLHTKKVLLAAGSAVRELPFAKSNDKNILTSDTILFIDKVPESLAIIGGGVVGTEFASLFGRMGADVHIIEVADQILPSEDGEVAKEMTRQLKKQNVTVKTGVKLSAVADNGKHCTLTFADGSTLEVAKVLLSVGRKPVTEKLGLPQVGIKHDKHGFVEVNDTYQTSHQDVYAIGDIIATPALAHTASAEAICAAEAAAGQQPHPINYDANPNAVYSYPEIASLGKTEEALKKEGVDYAATKFPFSPLAKAKIENADMGFVKILYDKKYKELLGVHIIGATATEMIAEYCLGKVLETTVDEIAQTIHPHPTISEIVMENAHAATHGAIHM